MDSITPNTAELYSAQIPALATLVSLGWDYLSPATCMEMRGGNQGILLRPVLIDELKRRRFDYKGQRYPLSTNAIDQIVRDLASPAMHEGLLSANEQLYNALTLGVTVTEFVGGKRVSVTVPIIDWLEPQGNSFIITEELELLTTDGTRTRRPDMVGYVNGIPLVVIELKNPADENATIHSAFQQIQTYKAMIPGLFTYNAICVISDGLDAKAGSISAGYQRYGVWKADTLPKSLPGGATKPSLPLGGTEGGTAGRFKPQLETLIKGMLNPATLERLRHQCMA